MSRTPAVALLGIALAGALTATPGLIGTALAASGPARSTDAAGDARDLLGRNQPTVDLLAAEVSLGASTITFSSALAALPDQGGTQVSSYATTLQVTKPDRYGSPVTYTLASTVDADGTARLRITDRPGDEGLLVPGTRTLDAAGRAVRASFDRDQVSQAFSRVAPLAGGDLVSVSGSSRRQSYLYDSATDSVAAGPSTPIGS